MPTRQRSIAIVGAGMGGLASAATLTRIGMKVDVYEQAARFERMGAGIQMMPNSMKVLLGIEAFEGDDLREAFRCYEATRKPRTSRIQTISSANTWMQGGNEDGSWLYGYDARSVPLARA